LRVAKIDIDVGRNRKRGERMPTQTPSSMMPYPCSEVFDSHKLEHTLVHVPHITAAQRRDGSRAGEVRCDRRSCRRGRWVPSRSMSIRQTWIGVSVITAVQRDFRHVASMVGVARRATKELSS
jgi:hypothetical protein